MRALSAAICREVQQVIGYEFGQTRLLDQALTHASAAPEHTAAWEAERLEFLGDRVLGLVIAEALLKKFPKENEGVLAHRLNALVDGGTCAHIAAGMELDRFILTGAKEPAARGQQTILADSMEALIGAIYLDGGFEPAQSFVLGRWQSAMIGTAKPPKPAKSALQEWAQGRGLPLPVYELVSRRGPDHEPLFIVRVRLEGFAPKEGQGQSQQQAESRAAASLLLALPEL